MKARIKATGEIVEIVKIEDNLFIDSSCCQYEPYEIEWEINNSNYWTRLEHQYAGMAMQGMLSDNMAMEQIVYNQEGMIAKIVATFAVTCATALVEKLKEKEERK